MRFKKKKKKVRDTNRFLPTWCWRIVLHQTKRRRVRIAGCTTTAQRREERRRRERESPSSRQHTHRKIFSLYREKNDNSSLPGKFVESFDDFLCDDFAPVTYPRGTHVRHFTRGSRWPKSAVRAEWARLLWAYGSELGKALCSFVCELGPTLSKGVRIQSCLSIPIIPSGDQLIYCYQLVYRKT